MKLLVATTIALLWAFSGLYSHSGRTDSKGGHHDHSTGGYHYHNQPSATRSATLPSSPPVGPANSSFNPQPKFKPDRYSGRIGCYKSNCGGILFLKNGKYGKFYGCSKFPKCKATTDHPFRCYRCKSTMVLRKNSKSGANFWGCSRFPSCKHSNSFR